MRLMFSLRERNRSVNLRGMEDFKTYFLSLSDSEKTDLAKRCDTSVNHLRNVAYGRKAGETLAINLERETKSKFVAEDFRPDVDWSVIRNGSGIRRECHT